MAGRESAAGGRDECGLEVFDQHLCAAVDDLYRRRVVAAVCPHLSGVNDASSVRTWGNVASRV